MPAAPRALYVHVPFCLHHCGYCDFTVIARRDGLIPRYLSALELEIGRASSDVQEVDTLFIGGGTPTHLSPADLQRLFDIVGRSFRVADGGEVSIEANPDGLTDARLAVLKSRGVNRISLGVQSFDAQVLKALERTHSPCDAAETVQRCASVFDNVSLDLIFGVPGQTLESWRDTLNQAIHLPVRHISTYGLTFEPGTPFFQKEQSGTIRRAPDELERDMYLLAIDMLTEAGFEHYEVSNFARPGFECRHNQTYWNADEYFAFGPGAARYIDGERSTNHRSVVRWLSAVESSQTAIAESERLSDVERAREAIMLGLRRRKGIAFDWFAERFGQSLNEFAGPQLTRCLNNQWMELHDGRVALTREGLLIADSVVSEFL